MEKKEDIKIVVLTDTKATTITNKIEEMKLQGYELITSEPKYATRKVIGKASPFLKFKKTSSIPHK